MLINFSMHYFHSINMKSIVKVLSVLVVLCSMSACENTPQATDGPYFGNGVHNGWADQNSIVIWTRLTENQEGNWDGEEFVDISNDEQKALDQEADSAAIMNAQIPEGVALEQMIGACPGATGEVKLTYYPQDQPEQTVETEWVKVNPDQNFTHQWQLDGLNAGTTYSLQLQARQDGNSAVSDQIEGEFYLPPPGSEVAAIDFCVVTCHDFIRKDTTVGHKIYQSMLEINPDFYVHTGDIEYYDKPRPWAMNEALMYFKWDRLFALPLQRDFWKQTTSYFMKDDHDALKNDAYPGTTYGTVSWERGLEIFDKEQFPTREKPYKTIRWGKDLQIWITEGRNYRSRNPEPDQRGKSIWGEEQKDWLFTTMQESDAAFKVLISNDPILGPDRENKKDNYSNANWEWEGDQIRDFLSTLDNVYICNGDRHWQYVTHLEEPDLWEFGSGAGADQHAGGWSQEDYRPEHRFLRVKGGYLYGQVLRENGKPTLKFQHHDVDGNVVHEEVFQLEEPS